MIVEINGKTYNGTVTVFDRFVLSQVEMVEDALLSVVPVRQEIVTGDDGKEKNQNVVRMTDDDKPKLPALFACVESWNVSNFPEKLSIETFPLTPRREAHNLIVKVFDAIKNVYNGEMEIPNE